MPKNGNDGKDNLIPFTKRTTNEQREIAKKGGKASGKARNKKKCFKEAFTAILSGQYTIGGQIADGYDSIVMAIVAEAMKGNVQAFKEIRDTIGEKPTDKVSLDTAEKITGVEINFVNKSCTKSKKERDPKIVGEYSTPIGINEE